MKKNIINIINAVLGILLIIGPLWLFPVCKGMPGHPHMKCYYSSMLVVGLGIAILVLSLIALKVKAKAYLYCYEIVTAIAALVSVLAIKGFIKIGNMMTMHWEIGLCKMNMMQCQQHFAKFVPAILCIVVLINIAGIIMNFVGKEK